MSDSTIDPPTARATSRPDGARFRETHRRRIDAPLRAVADAMTSITASEIRTFGPLMAVRGLPSRLTGGRGVADVGSDQRALVELFEDEGFVPLRRIDRDDVIGVEYGAAGRFWLPVGNRPLRFDSPEEFAAFDEPGHAKIWFDLTARVVDGTDGERVDVSTTTLVSGTDRAAERRFAPYWAVIRLPSGLIRRSWLAAIERRATA